LTFFPADFERHDTVKKPTVDKQKNNKSDPAGKTKQMNAICD